MEFMYQAAPGGRARLTWGWSPCGKGPGKDYKTGSWEQKGAARRESATTLWDYREEQQEGQAESPGKRVGFGILSLVEKGGRKLRERLSNYREWSWLQWPTGVVACGWRRGQQWQRALRRGIPQLVPKSWYKDLDFGLLAFLLPQNGWT